MRNRIHSIMDATTSEDAVEFFPEDDAIQALQVHVVELAERQIIFPMPPPLYTHPTHITHPFRSILIM